MGKGIYTIQTIHRAVNLLKALLKNPDGLSLDELSLKTGLHRATTYRILMNLLIEQEIAKNEEIRKLTNEIKRLRRILKYNR